MLPAEEVSNIKMQKKKLPIPVTPVFQMQEKIKSVKEAPHSQSKKHKVLKRNLRNEGSPSFQQQERSTSDSLPDSSRSGSEYRALRRKYLLLEEESCSLGRELSEVEAEVKSLEDEKFALLDQLVVLEGLLDPAELQPKG